METLKKLQESLPSDMDALLLTNPLHQFYVTGFSFTDGFAVIARDKAALFVDFRYAEAARSAPGVRAFQLHESTSFPYLKEQLGLMGISRLGFEDHYVTVAGLAELKQRLPNVTVLAAGPLLESLRVLKDDYERDCIRKAQAITDRAFTHILGFLRHGITETEAALELESFMRREGADGIAFPTICISGRATSMPHGEPRALPLEKGFVTMDFGCTYRGYCSDMTRTIVLGRADSEMRRVYETVLEAQRRVLDSIAWHADCAELDDIARRHIDDSGYQGCFGHSLGHGVGLQVHEAPTLSSRAAGRLLENGHVVTVEPGIYIDGKYGVRIEDMVMIHSKTAENITRSPKELIEL